MRKLMVMAGILLLCFPVMVSAQGEGFIQENDIGFSFFTGMPFILDGASPQFYRVFGVNLVYHPLPHIAIEPGILYYSEDGDRRDNMTWETDTFESETLGFALGIFYYHNLSTNLYMYAGPRFQFAGFDDSSHYDDGRHSESEESITYIALTFGLKYMFNDHFGVFGDLGYGFGTEERDYRYWDSTGVLTTDTTRETDVSSILSSSVGVSFYF